MGNSIEAVVTEILKDYENIVLEATKEAAHKGQQDIMDEAKKYLDEYYNSYSPRMYQRKYALKRAILPYWADRTKGDTASITIGVTYNAGALQGAYKSNSAYHQSGSTWRSVPSEVRYNRDLFSSDYGTPDPNWILDNFLKGEHGGMQRDFNATYTLMPNFIENELPNRITGYMESALFGAVTKRMR